MKFIIDRASLWCDDEKAPHELAHKEQVKIYENYTFKSFEDYDNVKYHKAKGIKFTDEGYDHKVTEKGICRTVNENRWVIEFNTLEDLIDFVNKNGSIIINDDNLCEYKRITIYDDWVE